MEFIPFDSPADFLALVRPGLEGRESANNLMYGLALRLESNPRRFQVPPYHWPPLLAAVRAADGLAAAALMTPPFNLILFSPRPDKAEIYAFLGRALANAGWSVPGVLAPSEDALAFAQAWSGLSGVPYRAGMCERVYELRQVIAPPQPPGGMRRATQADVEQVARWIYAFWQEALPSDAGTLQDARWNAEARIEEGDFFVWDDLRQPVAMAARTRPTPHGCCIGPVYTPPEQRAHGYATALTAALSQRLLRQGFQFTALFTDLNNPISNSIYMKIGYRPVCDFNEYLFG